MKYLSGKFYDARIGSINALEPHANPHDGDLPLKILDAWNADARICQWMPRAWTDDNVPGLKCLDLFDSNFVVAEHDNVGPQG